jgi:hypothetical protein
LLPIIADRLLLACHNFDHFHRCVQSSCGIGRVAAVRPVAAADVDQAS